MSRRTKTGECRQWMCCKPCKSVGYYDYIPYGFGGQIVVSHCGHRTETLLRITAKKAAELKQRWKKEGGAHES